MGENPAHQRTRDAYYDPVNKPNKTMNKRISTLLKNTFNKLRYKLQNQIINRVNNLRSVTGFFYSRERSLRKRWSVFLEKG